MELVWRSMELVWRSGGLDLLDRVHKRLGKLIGSDLPVGLQSLFASASA